MSTEIDPSVEQTLASTLEESCLSLLMREGLDGSLEDPDALFAATGPGGAVGPEGAPSSGKTGLVSIVIPALNEETNIGNLLTELDEALTEIRDFAFEILVIDDGSTD